MVDPVSIGKVNLGSVYGAKAQTFANEPEVLVVLARKALKDIGIDPTSLGVTVLKYPNGYPYIELVGKTFYHLDLRKIREKFWREFEMGVVNGS